MKDVCQECFWKEWRFPRVHQTISIKKRLIAGTFHLGKENSAVIGSSLAKKFQLEPGDVFHIILPTMGDSTSVVSKHKEFHVEGVVDFGFYEFNSRQIMVNINTARKLVGKGEVISGIRLFMPDMQSTEIAQLRGKLMNKLGISYQVSHWGSLVKSISEGYFQTIKKEKFLIFFILLILVLAGAFNVSSHLSISVLNKIREVSILRAMGAHPFFIVRLFFIQGFLISFTGTVIGIVLGFVLSKGLIVVQKFWEIVPPHVYQVSTIITDVRWTDVLLILLCSQIICFFACLWPAIRIFKLSLTEGLVSE